MMICKVSTLVILRRRCSSHQVICCVFMQKSHHTGDSLVFNLLLSCCFCNFSSWSIRVIRFFSSLPRSPKRIKNWQRSTIYLITLFTCGCSEFTRHHGLRIVGVIIRIHAAETRVRVPHAHRLGAAEASKYTGAALLQGIGQAAERVRGC